MLKTAADLEANRAVGAFKSAGVGKGGVPAGLDRVRNDATFWLDRNFSNFVQRLLWRKIDLLKLTLNRSLFLGLKEFEGHYAAYPSGGFYQRHKDCFRGDSGRIVSFILYLNQNWQPQDGGRLRIYAREGNDSYLDVDPIGGTMVCFMSADFEHEVLLSHKERLSFTGWFKS